MNARTDTTFAETLGMIAYARGIHCAPCLDRDMMDTLKGRELGDTRTVKELKAWTNGWTKANLAAAWTIEGAHLRIGGTFGT